MHSSRMRTARSLTVSAYLIVSHARPPGAALHAPLQSNHACPPEATTHAPWEHPRTHPGSNHAPPLLTKSQTGVKTQPSQTTFAGSNKQIPFQHRKTMRRYTYVSTHQQPHKSWGGGAFLANLKLKVI